MMIRINLLPYREAARKARRDMFIISAVVSALLGAGLSYGIYTINESYINAQKASNAYLSSEIQALESQLSQIDKLKKQIESLLSRKRVIENLQRDRGDSVHLVEELVRQVPEGIYLTSMNQNGQSINIEGTALSSARVSALMRNIEASPWLRDPVLIEVRAVNLRGRKMNNFQMSFKLGKARKVESEEEGGEE